MSDLPAIIKFDYITDAGAYGDATCPHCGAKGRYTYHFTTTDGAHLAAMRGCLEKFPQHSLARKHRALIEKAAEYTEKGWVLATWDNEMIAAIEAFAAGELSERDAKRTVESAERRRGQYLQKKFGRR